MLKKNLLSITKISLIIAIVFLGFNQKILAQTVAINNTVGAYSGNVIVGAKANHAMEMIYLGTEIGTSSFTTTTTAITRVEFSLNALSTATIPATVSDSFKIYMKNVSTATTVFATGINSFTGYTKVYDGSFTFAALGWNGVNLTTAFKRTANSNLQIMVVRNNNDSTNAGLFVDCSTGNSTSTASTTYSARRYNGTPLFVAGSSALTQSGFRPAIRLIHQSAVDVQVVSIATPPASSCFSAPQSFSVTIKNTGIGGPIAAGAVSLSLGISGANTFTTTQTSGAAIPIGGTQTITFSGVSINTVGYNKIQAIATLASDGDHTNDTANAGITTTATLTGFPYYENSVLPTTVLKYLKALNGSQLWGAYSTANGITFKGETILPYASTGGDTSLFIFLGAGSGLNSVGWKSLLYTDCMQLPAGQPSANYNLNFYMTTDSATAAGNDSLYVDISTDKGITWNRIAGFQRYDANTIDYTWVQKNVSLAAYAGLTIQIGFEGTSQLGNLIGLDEINVTANYPLPVTLNTFTGTREGTKNVLKWETVNETNNKGFELQRSINGKDFGKIGYVDSKATNGSSSSKIDYICNDENPFAATTNYYRLRQLDKNGKESFSNVVALKSAQISKVEISSIYPNPVQDKLNIILNTPSTEKVNIVITDLVGKTISAKTIETVQGDNNIQFNTTPLAKGTYLIKVYSSSNSELATQKFVKL